MGAQPRESTHGRGHRDCAGAERPFLTVPAGSSGLGRWPLRRTAGGGGLCSTPGHGHQESGLKRQAGRGGAVGTRQQAAGGLWAGALWAHRLWSWHWGLVCPGCLSPSRGVRPQGVLSGLPPEAHARARSAAPPPRRRAPQCLGERRKVLSLSWQRGLRGSWAPPCAGLRGSGAGGHGADPGVPREQAMGDSGESARRKGLSAPPRFPSVPPLASDSRGPSFHCTGAGSGARASNAARPAAGHQAEGAGVGALQSWQVCCPRGAVSGAGGCRLDAHPKPPGQPHGSLGVWQRLVVPGGHCP